MEENEVKSYKWGSFKNKPPKNAVIYVLNPSKGAVEAFVTDRFGNPVPLSIGGGINIGDYIKTDPNNNIIVEGGKLFVKKYNSGDEFIIVEESTNDYKLRLNVDKIEILDNKQNSLDIDGTGTKYPTVDAVNQAIDNIRDDINNVTGDKNYVYSQNFPASTWEIYHNLNKKPSATITDSAGTVVEGRIVINDGIKVVITFNAPFTGIAILN